MITDEISIRRNDEQFLTSELGDEIMIMNLEDGNYISMNNVGTIIWKMIKEPIKFKDLVTELVQLSDATEETCRTETIEYLNNLKENNMVLIDS